MPRYHVEFVPRVGKWSVINVDTAVVLAWFDHLAQAEILARSKNRQLEDMRWLRT